MLIINVVLMEPEMYFCDRKHQIISIKKVKPVLLKKKKKKVNYGSTSTYMDINDNVELI